MWLRHAAQTLLGIALAVTPVALWVAWSPAMLVGVMALSLVFAALLLLLTDAAAPGTDDRARLSDAFVEEVQKLHPMIHHHSPNRSPRFRRIMRRLVQQGLRTGR